MNFSSFLLGVLTSIVGAIVISIFAIFVNGIRDFIGFKLLFRLVIDSSRSGIINIFPNRLTYRTHKDHGKANEYIKKCDKEILYIGFWLAHGTEMESLINTIKEQCLFGKKVTIILLNPNNTALMKQESDFLNIDQEEMASRIKRCLQKLIIIEQHLLTIDNHNLKVGVHDIPLNYSSFMLDYESREKTRILVDYKVYQKGRENSFGIEYKNQKHIVTPIYAESLKLIADNSTAYRP